MLRSLSRRVHAEDGTPASLERGDVPPKGDPPEARKLAEKARLKVVRDAAKKPTGAMELDGLTTLSGVPADARASRLGHRCALEWVLGRYEEGTPKDPTIRERFNTSRFAEHRERVIDLSCRVTTVSVETMRILAQMPAVTVWYGIKRCRDLSCSPAEDLSPLGRGREPRSGGRVRGRRCPRLNVVPCDGRRASPLRNGPASILPP